MTDRANLDRRATALAAIAILAADLLGGCAGGPNSSGVTPAPTTSLSLEETARAGVETLGLVRDGGLWVVKGSALLISTDGGGTWRGASIPLPKLNIMVTRPFVLDADHAWSVTDNQTIQRTTDGGGTWTSAALPGGCQMHFSASFVDAGRGYVACLGKGAAATVMRTDDGGATWAVVAAGAATSSGSIGSNITASDRDTLWATSNDFDNGPTQALLAVSRDGGVTWTDARLPGLAPGTQPPNGPMVAMPSFFTPTGGLLVGGRGTGSSVFMTSDGGRSWVARGSVPAGPAAYVGSGSLVALDSQTGVVLHTSDAGAHWTSTPATGLPNPANLFGLVFADDRHGAAIVESTAYNAGYGALILTSDGGATWAVPDLVPPGPVPSAAPAGDEATVRDVVAAWSRAMVSGDEVMLTGLLSPLSLLDRAQPDPSPRPVLGIAITDAAPAGLTIDEAMGFAALDAVESTAWERAWRVTARLTYAGGFTTDEQLIVAPLLGSGWRIWTPDPAPAVSGK